MVDRQVLGGPVDLVASLDELTHRHNGLYRLLRQECGAPWFAVQSCGASGQLHNHTLSLP